MALKTESKDTLERLNDLCEKNGIEIVIPGLTKKEEKKENNKKNEIYKENLKKKDKSI